MEVKIIRNLIVVLLMFWLASCSHTRTYEEAYNEGYYLQSINILALNIEQKGIAKFKQEDAEHLRNLVNRVMVKYEADLADSAANDYEDKISTYNKLMEMHDRLSNQFYSPELSFFLDKYTSSKLKQDIAKVYYDQANSIVAKDSESYKKKAELYKQGLDIYDYKDINASYKKANNRYLQLVAQEYYKIGQQAARKKDYHQAAAAFNKAAEVYSPIGHYKDSEKLANYYIKIFKTQIAISSYAEGEQIAKKASSRADYRNAAYQYQKASNTYPNGSYRDASKKAEVYAEKGRITVYFNVNGGMQSRIMDAIRDQGIVTTTDDSNASQVNVRLRFDENYSDQGGSVKNETKKNGEKDYNLKIETLMNKITVTAYLNVTGLISYDKTFRVEKNSMQVNYSYTGDKPSYEFDHQDGNYLQQYQLTQEAKNELETQIMNEISHIAQDIKRL